MLAAGGLGEKRVQIGLNATSIQLNDKLLTVFPKLSGAGGYDLLRCLHNSRSLIRLQEPSQGFTPIFLKGEVGQARIYIRPVKHDLHTDREPVTSQVQC